MSYYKTNLTFSHILYFFLSLCLGMDQLVTNGLSPKSNSQSIIKSTQYSIQKNPQIKKNPSTNTRNGADESQNATSGIEKKFFTAGLHSILLFHIIAIMCEWSK